MHFVDQKVPEDVTDISTIKDMLEEQEVEEEEKEETLKSKLTEQLFTPHPRFPCLSETVSWICLLVLRFSCNANTLQVLLTKVRI